MHSTVTLIIPGNPIPNKRHRSCRNSSYQYDPQKKEKGIVRDEIRQQLRGIVKDRRDSQKTQIHFDHAQYLEVSLCFLMRAPKAYHGALNEFGEKGLCVCHKKPDLDNLEKFYLDCMTGLVYPDDAMIIAMSSIKLYSTEPRVLIEIKAHYTTEKEPYRMGRTLC